MDSIILPHIGHLSALRSPCYSYLCLHPYSTTALPSWCNLSSKLNGAPFARTIPPNQIIIIPFGNHNNQEVDVNWKWFRNVIFWVVNTNASKANSAIANPLCDNMHFSSHLYDYQPALTIFCWSTSAPLFNNSLANSVRPLFTACIRALHPFWGQSDKEFIIW